MRQQGVVRMVAGASRAGGRAQRRRRRAVRNWGILFAMVLVAAAGVVWWTTSGRTQTQGGPALGESVPDEGFEHVGVGTDIQYQAHPPASGPHYPAPAPAGVYDKGLSPGFWVHSLEHGYVVVVYKPPVSDAQLLQFREMLKDFPKTKFGNVKLVIAPYDLMLHPFAALAWDHRMWLDGFDRAKLLAFYRAYVDHGREDLP